MASRPVGAILALGLILVGLAAAGCETTQLKAARLHIRSQRILLAREGVKVKRVDEDVKVEQAALVRGDGSEAIAVTLRNASDDPVNDLPVVVGLRGTDGEHVLLNEGRGAYFQAHIPAIAPGEATTWVYSPKDPVPEGGSVFARIGVADGPPVTTATSLPAIRVSDVQTRGDTVTARVANETGIPQYEVDVYAWAQHSGRYVAAGRASAGDLEAGESTELRVKLAGDPHGADLHVSAPPTIFE